MSERQWVKVSERLPEKIKKVHVYDGREIIVDAWFRDGEFRTMWHESIVDIPDATHWMAFPEPPQE